MTPERTTALKGVLEHGVGAAVIVQTGSSGGRSGLTACFADLGVNNGPVVSIFPTGLHRHRVTLGFGRFARQCIDQMRHAPAERMTVARALLRRAAAVGHCTISPSQDLETWAVTSSEFAVEIIVPNVREPAAEEAIIQTAEMVMVPLMATLAELIGYDDAETEAVEFDIEGRVTEVMVTRRERSPRNRLLCLSIHGHQCVVCEVRPEILYGEAGSIIEVHHLEPMSNLVTPRTYDPATDLVPLCPNCHRAVHTRRPVPWTIEELKELRRIADARIL
ncbi:MAG: HNH endonuclease [Beijerinckiaceae bacterium]|nr:HNH endonuclease [Brevundimonas sp.]MCZ8302043.1 HNH endonuclease [Beijerinckiaceae bacterium]